MSSLLNDSYPFEPNPEVLEQNLLALQKINPILANRVRETKLDNFQAYQGSDNLAIDIVNKKLQDTLFIDPVKETEDTLKQLEENYALYPIMYFFGIGNSIIFKALLNNENHKRIIIIEPEIEILRIALGVVDFTKELSNYSLLIYSIEDFTYGRAFDIVMANDYKVYAKLYSLMHISPYYLRNYFDPMQKINKIMTKAIKQMVYSHGNDATDSLIGIDHHLKNIPDMLKSHKFLELVHKKNTDVAVIVSTGPSLDKQLPKLKKIKDYVTIIAPDASLALLEKAGIKPDIVTSLERTEIVSTLFENVSEDFQKDVVFLLASVLHRKSVKEAKGQNVICMRPFGYTFYFDDLKEWGYHGIGMSVSNMAHELAFIMKYDKVVLIGQDLAYGKDGESHSTGNVYGKNQRQTNENDQYIPAYGGKGEVRSYTGWILFKNYFEKSIEDTKTTMTTYNATEAGARIHGSVEIKFQDFIKEYVNTTTKKEPITLTKVDPSYSKQKMQRALEYINDWIEYGEKTKKGVEDVFLEVAKVCGEIEKAQEAGDLSSLDFEKMTLLCDTISNQKDLFKDATFSRLFFDVLQSYIIHQEFDLAKIIVKHPTNDEEKQNKIIEWIMAHKYWLFSLAGGMDAVVEVVKKAKANLKEELKG